jgi:hypothetical protein
MAKRRRKRSNWRGELASRVGILAAFIAFMQGLRIFEGMDSQTRLLFSGVLGIGAFLGTAIILLFVFSLFSRSKSKIEATFDFDTPPPSKQKAATDFEYEVAGLIHNLTDKRTEVVGGSGDGGIDIKVYDENDRLVGIVQCKNNAPGKFVYPAYIRDLNTVRHYHHVNIAYLVSTGRFSEESQKLAQQLGVKLIDGEALKKLRKKAIQFAARV